MVLARLLGPFVVAAVLGLAVGGPLICLLRRLKARQAISADAPERHREKAGTPTMGGLIILIPGAVAALLFLHTPWAWALLAMMVGFAAIGLLDDLLIVLRGRNLGLKARHKLALQFVMAGLFVWWYYSPQLAAAGLPESPLEPWLQVGWCILLIVGLSNAVNLTDGLDGLAAGVTLPAWITIALLALAGKEIGPQGLVADYGIASVAAGMAGATLAYLWFNAHPARVFMGDTGSLAIGAGLAGAAVMLQRDGLILLVLAVPVVEAASVILQVASFQLFGRRIIRMSPLHHHFELAGWPETHVVARFVIVSAMACGAALWIALAGR
ncbi:MAG: phospho-N-acetylmuramoyl-pentapeptide-transferase [Armatimonadetes bacterium]|nr:phospho-N-acetylmuramoyl-pentapeptide-transferase [Armatimonadota bacterium]